MISSQINSYIFQDRNQFVEEVEFTGGEGRKYRGLAHGGLRNFVGFKDSFSWFFLYLYILCVINS